MVYYKSLTSDVIKESNDFIMMANNWEKLGIAMLP